MGNVLSSYGWSILSFSKLCDRLQNDKGFIISNIKTDHDRELENELFANFCDEYGIGHNFSAPRTPQQNDVVEKKIGL